MSILYLSKLIGSIGIQYFIQNYSKKGLQVRNRYCVITTVTATVLATVSTAAHDPSLPDNQPFAPGTLFYLFLFFGGPSFWAKGGLSAFTPIARGLKSGRLSLGDESYDSRRRR